MLGFGELPINYSTVALIALFQLIVVPVFWLDSTGKNNFTDNFQNELFECRLPETFFLSPSFISV